MTRPETVLWQMGEAGRGAQQTLTCSAPESDAPLREGTSEASWSPAPFWAISYTLVLFPRSSYLVTHLKLISHSCKKILIYSQNNLRERRNPPSKASLNHAWLPMTWAPSSGQINIFLTFPLKLSQWPWKRSRPTSPTVMKTDGETGV